MSEYFWKAHRHVLRDIDALIAQAGGMPNFGQGYYTRPETGPQQHRMYEMDRDVAAYFLKDHAYVLKALDRIVAEGVRFIFPRPPTCIRRTAKRIACTRWTAMAASSPPAAPWRITLGNPTATPWGLSRG